MGGTSSAGENIREGRGAGKGARNGFISLVGVPVTEGE